MKRNHAFSMPEVLVVLAIIMVLAAIVAPVTARLPARLEQRQCQLQLHQIGLALAAYRAQHEGRPPALLHQLAPHFLSEQLLICPIVKPRRLMALSDPTQRPLTYPPWNYRYISELYFDRERKLGRLPIGFSEVYKTRGADTPVVICHAHRELWEWQMEPRLDKVKIAYHPTEPLLILRFGGQVTEQRKPGAESDQTLFGHAQLLVEY